MLFIIRHALTQPSADNQAPAYQMQLESYVSVDQSVTPPLADGDIRIESAAELLALYADTEAGSPLYSQLQLIRDYYIEHLDSVPRSAEISADITGLMIWLLLDSGINGMGESLEQTADRLCDLDIDADADRYTQIIFHLRVAVDRLYELELDGLT